MTMQSQSHHDDNGTLKSYLEGSDGISNAYQQLAQETPPPELDARILAAAHGGSSGTKPGVRKATVVHRTPNRALAASFMVCTLSAMFFFSQRDLNNPAYLASDEVGVTAFSSSAVTSVEAPLAAKAADVIEVRASLAQRSAPMAAEVADAPVTIVEVRGSLDSASRPVARAPERFSAQADETRREISVTGSRISVAPAAAPVADFRASRATWLAHLRELQESIAAADDAAREPLIEEFEAEKADFAKTHPSTNLAAQLAIP
jgi:hypothetical protein